MSDLQMVESPVLDILSNSDGPAQSATSDRPPKGEDPAKTAVVEEKADEAPKEETTEAVTEQAKEDKTPAWLKAEVTKERNRRRSVEAHNQELQEQLRQTLALANRYVPHEADKAEPKLEAFTDAEAYAEAKADWLADKKAKNFQAESAQKQQAAIAQKMYQDHQDRLSKAEDKYPGISDLAVDRSLPVSEAMGAAIMTSESGPDILHYLDENRDEAKRIYGLTPARAAAEIGKIEATLTLPKIPDISKAPKPIRPVGGQNDVKKDTYDPTLSSAEWERRVDADRAARLAALTGSQPRK